MTEKILLNKSNGNGSVNTNGGVSISLRGRKKSLPLDDISTGVSLEEVYNNERKSSTDIRLTFQVNTIATNVLNNNVTEIVSGEGSSHAVCLNYTQDGGWAGTDVMPWIKFKDEAFSFWSSCDADHDYTIHNAILDTQPSLNMEYHPGKDIFNNHYLRSKTFKCVCQMEAGSTSDNFNTLSDRMRFGNGTQVVEDIEFPQEANVPNNGIVTTNLHLYTFDDVYSFKDALDVNTRIPYNGWVGFHNGAKIDAYETGSEQALEINKTILNKNPYDFIDLYPSRDLYSFTPKYNSEKQRVEKNWEYCLTYPSTSTTNVDFIGQGSDTDGFYKGALKVSYFDEMTKADNGAGQKVLYCVVKHGLQVGDYVNVYSGGEEVLSSTEVTSIADDYTFIVYSQNRQISSIWVSEDDISISGDAVYSAMTYTSSGNFITDGNITSIIVNGRANMDINAQHISFKKCVGGNPLRYYVRIFSRLPNFKLANIDASVTDLYSEDCDAIETYQRNEYDFESDCSKLGFARNIYSDQMGQIVYGDSISYASLRDNLGRPLTSLYLTIVKNNKGYKEWYGKDGRNIEINNDNVEYSHCFGKISAAFKKSPYISRYYGEELSAQERIGTNSIYNINNIETQSNGLDISVINSGRTSYADTNEVCFDEDVKFYGDLVCFDESDFKETTIDSVYFRFNTAQRELLSGDTAYKYFHTMEYDEIVSDDYDYVVKSEEGGEAFSVETETLADVCQRKEGYFYCPHYEIPINSFSEAQYKNPSYYTVRTMVQDDDGTVDILVLEKHGLSLNDKVYLYDASGDTIYNGEVVNVISEKKFEAKFYYKGEYDIQQTDFPDILVGDTEKKTNFRLFNLNDENIPNYASIMHDGSCRAVWRNIIRNGYDKNTSIETYPFANGALYINRLVNLCVRRQDPFDEYNLWSTSEPYDSEGLTTAVESENDYSTETEIVC